MAHFGETIKKQMGAIDLLVNNAGIFIPCELLSKEGKGCIYTNDGCQPVFYLLYDTAGRSKG